MTLSRLQALGYDALPTVLIDDGSAQPMSAKFAASFPWVRCLRFEKSEGYSAQRNRIARLLSTPLMLTLDDDSFPIAGDLAAACDWLVARPGVFALSFQIIRREESVPGDYQPRPPFPVRDFIGCGNLLKREVFLALGGYEENFEFYLEEPEICVRALQAGYTVEGYPAFVIQHNLSPSGRDPARRAHLLIRNEILLALILFPFPWSWRRMLTCVPGYLYRNPEFRPYWRSMILGALEAVRYRFSGRFTKKRMTPAQFADWGKIPIAPRVLVGLSADKRF